MWRVEDPAQRYDSSGKPDLSGSSGRSRKRLRTTLAQSPEDATTGNAGFGRTAKGPSRTCPAESANGGGSGSRQHVDCPHPESDAWEGSSSTIELVAKVSQYLKDFGRYLTCAAPYFIIVSFSCVMCPLIPAKY